jgi:acyl-CoA reductase-like NAD-dependent aldehyde dehydrogenase
MCEEIFGPILGVIEFETEDEVVRMANDTEYGLISYAFTNDLHRGQRLIEKLETGMMGLNTGLVSNAAGPFGGVKQSGVGRRHRGIPHDEVHVHPSRLVATDVDKARGRSPGFVIVGA